MKILELQAENFKRLKAVTIRPKNRDLVAITGKNAQGKTSVLDAIWNALTSARNLPAQPIRAGQSEAMIKLDLGELIITRTFKGKPDSDKGEFTQKLTVTSADGAKYPSPNDIAAGLMDAISFDPLAFAQSKEADQIEALQRLVPDFDFAEWGRKLKSKEEERRDANREVKRLESALSGMPAAPGDNENVLSLDEAMQALEDARKENEENSRLRQEILDKEKRCEILLHNIGELEKQLATMKAEHEALVEELCDAEEVPEPENLEPYQRDVRRAQEAAQANASAELRKRTAADLKKAREQAAAADTAITKLKEEREKKVAAAEMPAGLEFGDGGITVDGLPFEQASEAQRLRISMAVAMAGNPELRVIRVKQGSLLDEDGLAIVAKMAEKADYQIWMERVDSSGKMGFYIEDGEVAAENE